ncbi:MAG: hypothetical protein ABI678_25335 [Kofleriaceae bacterium]
MGGNRNDRDTRAFDPKELERLARESAESEEPAPAPAQARADTLQDPMTMALLAEVARNARTQDFDPLEMPNDKAEAEPELAHPNLKRR